MGVVVHGLCYTVEFSVVFLTFILSFDFLFQFYEGHLLVEAPNILSTAEQGIQVLYFINRRQERDSRLDYNFHIFYNRFLISHQLLFYYCRYLRPASFRYLDLIVSTSHHRFLYSNILGIPYGDFFMEYLITIQLIISCILSGKASCRKIQKTTLRATTGYYFIYFLDSCSIQFYRHTIMQ